MLGRCDVITGKEQGKGKGKGQGKGCGPMHKKGKRGSEAERG